MTPNEVARVQAYLRMMLGNDRLAIHAPAKAGAPVEVALGGEVVGVLYRDDEDGEVSYSLVMSILEEDLPPVGPVRGH